MQDYIALLLPTLKVVQLLVLSQSLNLMFYLVVLFKMLQPNVMVTATVKLLLLQLVVMVNILTCGTMEKLPNKRWD
ncbi:hypothetical protein D3C72_1846940 [compost metagenome]